MTKALAVGVLLSTVVVGLPSAQRAAPQRDSSTLSSTVTAVLVDVVVRDRNGRPVLDLDAADFSLAEDGVPHKVESFTRISRGAGIGVSVAWRAPGTTVVDGSPASPANAAADPPQGEGATAIVFDQLSSESLRLAQKATLGYIPMSGEARVQVGVFSNESGIRVLQGFTTDRALIRRAVANLVPTGATAGEQKADRVDELQARRRDLYGQDDPTAGGAAANTQALAQNASAIGQRETELRMVQTELNMIRAMENLDRDFRGYDTFLTLVGVVRTLAGYPGRKTIVFFSEGLPVSPVLSARLESIIEAANRANVTAYAIDAQGLRTKSVSTNMQKEVDAFAEDRLRQLSTGADRTDQPLMREMERVEDTMRLDSRTGLARLAGDTGGILIEQSNDLSSAFRRIDEDSQFHYLLTYAPTNTVFDGGFRSIQVKVRRPGAQVFARRGYRAIRSPVAAAAGAYEAPALALLDRGPLPNAFPVHAASFSFPDPARPGLTPVIVQVGTSRLQFQVNDRRAAYAADAAIVVRVRDEQGREIQKVSQQYLLAGDVKDLGRRETRRDSVLSRARSAGRRQHDRIDRVRCECRGGQRTGVDPDGSATQSCRARDEQPRSRAAGRRCERSPEPGLRAVSAALCRALAALPQSGRADRQGGRGRAAVLLHALRAARRRHGACAASAERPRARRRAALPAHVRGPPGPARRPFAHRNAPHRNCTSFGSTLKVAPASSPEVHSSRFRSDAL